MQIRVRVPGGHCNKWHMRMCAVTVIALGYVIKTFMFQVQFPAETTYSFIHPARTDIICYTLPPIPWFLCGRFRQSLWLFSYHCLEQTHVVPKKLSLQIICLSFFFFLLHSLLRIPSPLHCSAVFKKKKEEKNNKKPLQTSNAYSL